jgi:hypothetical protein
MALAANRTPSAQTGCVEQPEIPAGGNPHVRAAWMCQDANLAAPYGADPLQRIVNRSVFDNYHFAGLGLLERALNRTFNKALAHVGGNDHRYAIVVRVRPDVIDELTHSINHRRLSRIAERRSGMPDGGASFRER